MSDFLHARRISLGSDGAKGLDGADLHGALRGDQAGEHAGGDEDGERRERAGDRHIGIRNMSGVDAGEEPRPTTSTTAMPATSPR